MLPWIIPIAIVVIVVLAALGNVALGLAAVVAGLVGIPLVYRGYAQTRRELRARRDV